MEKTQLKEIYQECNKDEDILTRVQVNQILARARKGKYPNETFKKTASFCLELDSKDKNLLAESWLYSSTIKIEENASLLRTFLEVLFMPKKEKLAFTGLLLD